ncbi:MAG: tRNA pseudouridine(55) synthase TruB [Deltaproteobacteria bacterium]|nr:tRNA pseudouridine(55) synthase TruB [Deltaproteobacteria bacterium]
MHGVLLIDKPKGMSSHRVVSILRKKLATKKIGHAGTLDPEATGVLVCCVGKATKISQYLMGEDKVYQTKVVLGATSTTYDHVGEITQTNADIPSSAEIQQVLVSFEGVIEQKPPLYSAIKKAGKKLYQYARAGIDVEIPSRKIHIQKITLLPNPNQPDILHLQVHCQKGTYIRSLAHDIGQVLGCGGYAQDIRRLQSGQYHIDNCIPMDALEAMSLQDVQGKMLTLIQALQASFVSIAIDQAQALHIRQGKPMDKLYIQPANNAMVLLHTDTQEAVAITRCDESGQYALLRVI